MRTFSRDAFLEAREQWDTGRFGWRWQSIRRIAAERGFIYPPVGSVHDDREVESPSQRAIIYAALEENPTQVETIVRRSHSWFDVVDGIIGMEAMLGREAYERERDIEWERVEERPPNRPYRRVGFVPVGDIVEKIGGSL